MTRRGVGDGIVPWAGEVSRDAAARSVTRRWIPCLRVGWGCAMTGIVLEGRVQEKKGGGVLPPALPLLLVTVAAASSVHFVRVAGRGRWGGTPKTLSDLLGVLDFGAHESFLLHMCGEVLGNADIMLLDVMNHIFSPRPFAIAVDIRWPDDAVRIT